MSPPAVFALGSCRVTAPVKLLARTGKVDLVNDDYRWYAHSAAEVIQRLDHMQGRRVIPADRLAEVLDTDSCPTPPGDCPTDFALPPVGLFEISTRSGKWLDDVLLHSTLVGKRGIEGWTGRLETPAEMTAHLRDIAGRFGQLILGCNIVYGADLKTPQPYRLQLNYMLKRLSHEDSRISVVDPNEIIDAGDPRRDLEDLNHFKPAFVPRVAELYRRAIHAAHDRARAQARVSAAAV